MMANRHAERAQKLVGTRFRAQGRDPRRGLDCAGLAIATFRLPAERFRSDYRLRGDHRRELESALERDFRRIPKTQCRAGDMLMLAVERDQLHLAIRIDAGFVHADARHGKVVETPGEPRWKTVAVYRRRARPLKAA